MSKRFFLTPWLVLATTSMFAGISCDEEDNSTSNAALCKKGCALYEYCHGDSSMSLRECTADCRAYWDQTLEDDPCEPEIRSYHACAVNLGCEDVSFGDGYDDIRALNGNCGKEITALNICDSAGPDTGEDVCETCLSSKCNSELLACSQNSACVSLLDCISNCTDEACTENCLSQYAGGAEQLLDILECTETSCSTECA